MKKNNKIDKLKVLKFILITMLALIFLFVLIFGLGGYNYYNKSISQIPLSEKVQQVQSDKNFVKYEDLSPDLINATIAVEDHRFREHGSIDIIALGRAIFSNIKASAAVEGGSTITQQVAKNLYFMSDIYNRDRKIAELILSYHLEKNYSKEEIFELYVNTIYYGNGYYGIKAAANGYFNKDPKDLTLSESTLLAGVPNAPSVYAPTVNMELCKSRQSKVINSMVKYKYISQDQANDIVLGANFKE
ncbi:MAG: transglycosylase domain-containing protein [Clostridia bacterium]|nr:transglycosylase domain-containing protein [Clostridia bacterium]